MSGYRLSLVRVSLRHNDREWRIERIRCRWFAMDDSEGQTGPFNSPAAAEEWICGIAQVSA